MNPLLYLRVFLLLLTAALVSSCATLDKDECLVANWESIGYEDGSRGFLASRIGKHRSACAKHGITPDLALYTKGRMQGLVNYCQARVGYRTGVSGGEYKNVCSAKSEGNFLKGYYFGQRIYTMRSRIHSLEHKIREEEKILDEHKGAISNTESELIHDGGSHAQRAALLDELKHQAARKHDIEDSIEELAHLLEGVKYRLRRLQARNTYQR